MSSTDDLFARADGLLDRALDLPAAERAAFVEREAAGEEALHELVLRLLGAAEGGAPALASGGALRGPLGEAVSGELAEDGAPLGSRIGRYRLLEEIGRGGMAVVYRAERADGEFEQQVAVKLLRRELDGEAMISRFEQERQILAAVHHPGIAQLLDGGVAPDGRPYLVMELVAGEPIDRYADRQRLSVGERLRLFLQVGRAVEEAHRNLIIHRDIKPSNLLVTADGHAKLLDFGIAKLLDPLAPGEAALTRTQDRLLTPAYASPEQIRGAAVTTATDVYQLGLLLHVLLTGGFPYTLGTGDAAQAARAITTDEPQKPSAAVVTGAAVAPGQRARSAAEVAEARRSTPARLKREFAGDLDTVVTTVLRKEPERRYRSAAQLLEDVERYLAGRPIAARPDTLSYRLSKFVGRHKAAVATAAVAALLLAGLTVGYTAQLARERDRAELAAAQAGQVADFLRSLFAVSAPTRSRGEQVTARQLLDRGAARIDRELARQPELQAEMLTLIGEVYGELALYAEGEAVLRRAVALRRRHPGEDRLGLAASLAALARVAKEEAHLAEARGLYREALALRERALGPDHAEVGRTLDGLGHTLALDGKFAVSCFELRRAVQLLERNLGESHPEVGQALIHLGKSERQLMRFDAATRHLERAVSILAAAYAPGDLAVAEARAELGSVLTLTHRFAAARAAISPALPVLERAYGADHPAVAMPLLYLASSYIDGGDSATALPLVERALAIREKTLGPHHPQVALALVPLGQAQTGVGQDAAGRRSFERAVSILEAAHGTDHADVAMALDALASHAFRSGRKAEALGLYERVLAIRERVLGPTQLFLTMTLYRIASLRLELGDARGAEGPVRRLLAIEEGRKMAEHAMAMPKVVLARSLTAQRRFGEALPLLLPLAQGPGEEARVQRSALAALIELYEAQGDPQRAADSRRELARLPPVPATLRPPGP